MAFDDLRFFGSGASEPGATQLDPNANLGGNRSGTELSTLAVFGAMPGIFVVRVSEANAPGVGTLESDGAGNVRWAAPGEAPGAWTAVADAGPSVVLPCGSKGLRVTRDGDVPIGQVPLKLLDVYNGEIGGGNVSHAQRVAGRVIYRCVFFKNVGADELILWVDPSTSNLQVGFETPVSDAVQVIANETTAPTAVTFSGAGTMFTLAAGAAVGMWIKRTTAAGADAAARVESEILVECYDAV